jgi:hypothetical protein
MQHGRIMNPTQFTGNNTLMHIAYNNTGNTHDIDSRPGETQKRNGKNNETTKKN